LDNSIDAAVLVVQHLSRSSDANAIASIYQRQTSLHCQIAIDQMILESGNVYIAPPDHHLVVERDHLNVIDGPHENRYRPSIDVLFRSAAVAFGNRVIAVVLTGMLEDGTSGMSAVKQGGGIAIVQNPQDAEFPSMPSSILNTISVDYEADLSAIPSIIHEILDKPLPPQIQIPKQLQIEADITKRMMSNIDDLKTISDRSDFVCPDCGGGLWLMKNDPNHRYRCHTGHVYTEKLLNQIQDERLEESIWVSIRMLEEKANLLKVMGSRHSENGSRTPDYTQRIEETNRHIKRLKKLLHGMAENRNEPNRI
jgi:two-component system chemotaxis response regulator CheB